MTTQTTTTPLKYFCAPVIHPVTGESNTNYKKFAKDQATREVCKTAFGKEWENLAQGYHKKGIKGMISLFVLDCKEIKRIPADHNVTYSNIFVG